MSKKRQQPTSPAAAPELAVFNAQPDDPQDLRVVTEWKDESNSDPVGDLQQSSMHELGFREVAAAAPPPPDFATVWAEQIHAELVVNLNTTADGYVSNRIDDLRLTGTQAIALRLLTDSLKGEKLLGGEIPVDRPERAIAWLLEQIAVQVPEPAMDKLFALLNR
jgi:hypothetical protein